MRAAKAVAVAIAVWFIGSVLIVFVRQWFASIEQLESTSGQIVWSAGPQLVLAFTMVLLAGLAYGRRAARRGRVFAAAVLAPPAVQIIVVTVLNLVHDSPGAVVAARLIAALAGMGLGWLLLVRSGARAL